MARPPKLRRRHPLCPECGYDLVATIDAGRNVCPECGFQFQPHELKHALLPEDWTLGRGLLRAALVLLLRAALCFAGWTALLTGTLLAGAWIATRLGGGWIIFIMLLTMAIIFIAAGAVGRILAGGMDEIAGFTSPLVSALIALFAWLAIAAGTVLTGLLAPMRPSITGSVILIGCVMSLILIVKTHHFEDY
ncbi:MAG: hypothetical protein SYC29_15775 [Planctomycetota bacterium]|nr:hypothetical protein [Planctomycetota bacterium]